MSERYSVFVCSSDSYSDIWDVFFDMFRRFWPEYDGEIYLQTEEKECRRDDMNIICTKVGKRKAFGSLLRAGLEKVPSRNILLIMIDYMMMGPVKVNMLGTYYQYFRRNNLDALYLVYQKLPMRACEEGMHISKLLPSEHTFSYQVSFWKKEMLKEMALPHENPWTSEWYGNKRALRAELDIRCVNDKTNDVFIYNHAGCLHRGKWLQDAEDFLNEKQYSVDFERRGHYKEEYRSFKVRFLLKMTFILHGLKGSYWYRIKK